MELDKRYTKSGLDWIGDIFTVLLLLPVALIVSILVGGYFILKFPIWWLRGKWKGFKRKSINRDTKKFSLKTTFSPNPQPPLKVKK